MYICACIHNSVYGFLFDLQLVARGASVCFYRLRHLNSLMSATTILEREIIVGEFFFGATSAVTPNLNQALYTTD